MEPILQVNQLSVSLASNGQQSALLKKISFDLLPGEILGLVGASGSGKSITALSIMHLLPNHESAVIQGSICFDGLELTTRSEKEMRSIRGREISMIFQEPMTCLNPVISVGRQIIDVICAHTDQTKSEARQHALTLLSKVHIQDPHRVVRCYPYELSGGMRQRVMIAMALACSPKILIADEPTTALDVTVQLEILDILREIADRDHTSILFISHDLAVVSQLCSRVIVMQAGEIVEANATDRLLHHPSHPYTQSLLAAVPRFIAATLKES
jgi:peptide/nickel transport system ATP-binding protein